MLLFEFLFLAGKRLNVVKLLILLDIAEDLDNAANFGHAQLLIQGIVGSRTLGPELSLTRGSFMGPELGLL